MSDTASDLSIAQLVQTMLKALGGRAQRWAALVSAFAVCGYAVLRPDPWRLATAALFTLFAYLWLRRLPPEG